MKQRYFIEIIVIKCNIKDKTKKIVSLKKEIILIIFYEYPNEYCFRLLAYNKVIIGFTSF